MEAAAAAKAEEALVASIGGTILGGPQQQASSPDQRGAPPPPQTQLQVIDEEAAIIVLKARRARYGKWFVVHVKLLPSITYEEVVDMKAEFWVHHVHGGEPALEGMVMVRLTNEMIASQYALVRTSSYRWENVRGLGPESEFAAPGNFGWFLRLVKEHGWIGWMDFMANVVVNVPNKDSIDYMGGLYAKQVTVPQGLFDVATLGAAMTRAWVYQETAFGALDKAAVEALLGTLRALGMRALAGDVECLCGEFTKAAAAVGTLMQRRGWDAMLAANPEAGLTDPLLEYHATDTPGGQTEAFADVLVQRVSAKKEEGAASLTEEQLKVKKKYPRDWKLFQRLVVEMKRAQLSAGTTLVYVLDYYTRTANAAEPWIRELLTTSPLDACDSLDTFMRRFGFSMIKAYCKLAVTYETDRVTACTAVARATVAERYGESLEPAKLMEKAWVGAARNLKEKGAPGFGVLGIQPTITEGQRLFGLGELRGTPILEDENGHPGCYKTGDGAIHDIEMDFGSNLGLSYAAGEFADADGIKYHGFVCAVPPLLAAEGVLSMVVFRRVRDPPSRPAIVGAMLQENKTGFPAPAEEATFA